MVAAVVAACVGGLSVLLPRWFLASHAVAIAVALIAGIGTILLYILAHKIGRREMAAEERLKEHLLSFKPESQSAPLTKCIAMRAAQLAAQAVGAAYVCPALKRLVQRFRTAARRPQAVHGHRAGGVPLVLSPWVAAPQLSGRYVRRTATSAGGDRAPSQLA